MIMNTQDCVEQINDATKDYFENEKKKERK